MKDIKKENNRPFFSFLKMVAKGAILILPLVLVVILVSFLLDLIVKILTPISLILSGGQQPTIVLHVVSFLILVVLLYAVGVTLTNRYGKHYFTTFEKDYLYKIPFYSTIKETIQQFTGMKEMPFKHVVLVDIYGSGTKMTGFVTQNTDNQYFSVFVPTAPNPMNGNIYHVPRELVTFVDIKPEAAMRSIIGLGTGSDTLIHNIKEFPFEEIEK